jgi:hypothetical protein
MRGRWTLESEFLFLLDEFEMIPERFKSPEVSGNVDQ